MACLASSNSRGLPVMPEVMPVVPRTTAVAPTAIAPVVPAAVAPATVTPAGIAPAAIAPAEIEIGPVRGESDGIGVNINMSVLKIDAGDSGANFAEAVRDAGNVVVGLGVSWRRIGGRGRQGGRDAENAGGKQQRKCLQSTETHRHNPSPDF